jgi:hypothetical protein
MLLGKMMTDNVPKTFNLIWHYQSMLQKAGFAPVCNSE